MVERAAARLALILLASCGRLEFTPMDEPPDGVPLITVGGSEADAPRTIALTSTGNVVIAGNFRDVIDFGCGPTQSAGGADGFLVELTPELRCVRTWTIGGPGDDLAIDVTEAGDGSYILTGEFRQTAMLGAG